MLEELAKMFGMGGGQGPQPSNPQMSPEIQQILAAAGYAPEDPDQARRRAIASGLASFGKNLAGSTQDFLPALAGAAGSGATDYHKAREGQEDDRRKAAIDLMKQVFGYDKAQDTNSYRMGTLDERIRSNQIKEGQAGQKIEISLGGLEERIRHNKGVEGQGDTRLDQSAARIKQQQEAGARDAARLKAQLEGDYYAKTGKGDLGGAKAKKNELDIRAKILRVLNDKVVSLGIDAKGSESLSQDELTARRAEFGEYSKALHAEFGYDEKGMPLPDTAQPVPQPAPAEPAAAAPPAQSGGQTTGLGSRTDPVKGIATQEQYEVLPSGSYFISPKDGRLKRKP